MGFDWRARMRRFTKVSFTLLLLSLSILVSLVLFLGRRGDGGKAGELGRLVPLDSGQGGVGVTAPAIEGEGRDGFGREEGSRRPREEVAPKDGGSRAGWIRFRVVDHGTGDPIPSVQVQVFSVDRSPKGREEVLFFSQGFEGKREVLVPPPPKGEAPWILEFRGEGHFGYQVAYRAFLEGQNTLKERQPFEIGLRKGRPFSGRVLDPEGGPVGGAKLRWGARDRRGLWIEALPSSLLASWTTDPKGTFQMEGLDQGDVMEREVLEGQFFLTGRRKGLGSGYLRVDSPLTTGRVLPPFFLGEGKPLRGRLLHLDGSPVPGMDLMLRRKSLRPRQAVGRLRAIGTTDKQGNFVMKGLDGNAPYVLWAFLPLREEGRNRGSLAVFLDPALVPNGGEKSIFLQKVQVELGVKRSGSGGKLERPSLLLKVSGSARSRVQTLVWHPGREQARARISLPPGRVLELKAMVSGMLLSQKTVTIQGGSGLQRIHLDLSLPKDLVTVRFVIHYPDPGPNRHYNLVCEVPNPLGGWIERPCRSLGQGLYQVRLLPGLRRIRMRLYGPFPNRLVGPVDDVPPRPDDVPPRHLFPERLSYPQWFPFDKVIRVGPGGKSQFSWVPRPCSRLFFLLREASRPKEKPRFKKVLIQRLGSLSGSGNRILDQVRVPSNESWCILYKPDLPPGRHRFRLKAEGYAPEEVEVLLPSQIDQRVTVSLKKEK